VEKISVSELSVVITTKNNAKTVEECVNRVLKAPPKNKEVTIVYGSSRDETEKIIQKYQGEAKIICDDLGTGSAINTGALNSHGDIIIYVEGHFFITNDAFLKVLNEFEKNPEAGYIVFYRYIPKNVKGWTSTQKFINFWRESMKNSTMGQFRAFRRQTFFDVGGFWVFPKRCDDLEFATRMYETKWKMKVLDSKSWDYPSSEDLFSLIKYMITTGMGESCWFHIYHNNPYARKEFKVKNKSLTTFIILFKILIRRMFFAPLFALKVGLKEKYLTFIPYYTICHWSFVIGFLHGKKWWGKEKWDMRVQTLKEDMS
jgi:glycosyltransferase involved in cell wall biosynthesis